MATVVKKPPRKFFYAVFRDADGKQIWRSTKTTDRKAAMEIAVQLERAERIASQGMMTKARAQELLDEVLRRIEPDETILADSAEKYLTEWLASKNTSGKAASTVARYRPVVDTFLESLGKKAKRPLPAVTRQDVEKWRKKLLAEGRAGTTVNWSLKVLRGAFQSAVDHGDLRFNPAKAVESITGANARGDKRIPFTADQVRALLGVANEEWRGMILFAYHCGIRLADCANLTWDAIDLVSGTVTLNPQKTDAHDREVKIVMHGDLIRYLETRTAGDDPQQPLFPSLHGRSVGSGGKRGGLSNEFTRLIPKAKIRQIHGAAKEGKGRRLSLLSFHSLRHAFVTKAHQAAGGKVSAEVLKGMAGHSTDEAHRAYLHLQTEEQRPVVAEFESVL